jgi:hypothetical protein
MSIPEPHFVHADARTKRLFEQRGHLPAEQYERAGSG